MDLGYRGPWTQGNVVLVPDTWYLKSRVQCCQMVPNVEWKNQSHRAKESIDSFARGS